jgi:hypothetical protein
VSKATGPGSRTIKRLEDALAHSKWEREYDVKRLEETIYGLRRDLLHLAPYEFREIIQFANVLPDDLWRWERDAVAAIIEKTPVLTAKHPPYDKDRAECPLCRDSPGTEDGYAIPIGLERHLTGYGNMPKCPVIHAAMDLHQHRDQSFRSPLALKLEADMEERIRQKLKTRGEES